MLFFHLCYAADMVLDRMLFFDKNKFKFILLISLMIRKVVYILSLNIFKKMWVGAVPLNTILKFIIVLITTSLVWSQTTAIPDTNFEQKLIDLGHDDILDGSVLTSTVEVITELDLRYSEINDLTGIEAFTALTTLNVKNNNLTTLDLSACIALTYLNIHTNQLSALDVGACIALTELDAYRNELTTVDLSTNTALAYLEVGDNQLTALDVSANTALIQLEVNRNQLTALDLSQNTSLTYLASVGNPNLICIYAGENTLDASNIDDFQFLSSVPCTDLIYTPQITSVFDVPNDQGGRVYVEFNASFFDGFYEEHVGQAYSFYRYDNFIPDSSGWVLIGSGEAIGNPSYIFEALTITDSTYENDGMTEFKVVASTAGGIFHSEPMMGYSVDNILPGVPGGVMAILEDNTVELSWNESVDEDFQYFMVEKTSMSGFEMIETAVAFYVDEDYISNEVHSYRVAAVDHAGNQSEFSEVVEVAVLAIDNQVTPDVFALHQNYPNPFNPTTQIKYVLAEDALVSVDIYDVMGKKIKSLMNTNQSSGSYSLRWDATNNIGEAVSAGMYIYTIQASKYRATKKMVLLK